MTLLGFCRLTLLYVLCRLSVAFVLDSGTSNLGRLEQMGVAVVLYVGAALLLDVRYNAIAGESGKRGLV